jgi:hypothetical protein
MIRFIAAVLVFGLLPATGWAEQPGSSSSPKDANKQAQVKQTAAKRAWVREQVVKGMASPREVRAVQAHVDLIRPQQIDKLVHAVLAQQLAAGADPQQVLQQAQLELARARLLRQMLEQEYLLWRNGNVGYAPVVTWLPEGASMGASAVISPDRRYVRTSVSPFFSSVGPVYTYNLNTGETRLQPQPQRVYSPNPYPWPQLGYGQSNIVPMGDPPVPSEKLRNSLIWGRR